MSKRTVSGPRPRVELTSAEQAMLEDAIERALAAADGDLALAAAVLQMPLAAVEAILEEREELRARVSVVLPPGALASAMKKPGG